MGIVVGLHAHPKGFRCTKKLGQTNGSVRSNRPLFENDVMNPRHGHMQLAGQPVRCQPQGLQKLLPQDFTRMKGPLPFRFLQSSHTVHLSCHDTLGRSVRNSVIIDDLNVICIAAFELKAKSILIINADAVLFLAITLQGFQSVSWRRPKITDHLRMFQLKQLSYRDAANT